MGYRFIFQTSKIEDDLKCITVKNILVQINGLMENILNPVSVILFKIFKVSDFNVKFKFVYQLKL